MKKNWLYIGLGVVGVWYFFLRNKTTAAQPVQASTASAGALQPWYAGFNSILGQGQSTVNQTGSILTGVGSLVGSASPLLKSIGSWFAGLGTNTPSAAISPGVPYTQNGAGVVSNDVGGFGGTDTSTFTGDSVDNFDWNGNNFLG